MRDLYDIKCDLEEIANMSCKHQRQNLELAIFNKLDDVILLVSRIVNNEND